MLPERLGIYPSDDGGVFRALHAPFYLHAGDTRLLDLAEPVDKAVILQRHRVIVHAPAEGILHAARLRTHAAVAAAPSDKAGHITLPGMAEAQRAMDEYLRLYWSVFRNVFYLLKAQLARKHCARQPHLRRRLHAGEVVDAHLRARMEGNVRQGAAYRRDKPQILNDNPVRAA